MTEPELTFSQEMRSSKTAKEGIKRLYEIYARLNSDEDKKTVKPLFKELLVRVAASEGKEKQLACQFITRFLEYYPELEVASLDALFDVCEEEDVASRRLVQRELVTVCRKLPHLVSCVSYVLAQLLRLADAADIALIHDCLKGLIVTNANLALIGMFAQIRVGNVVVIDGCLKFLQEHLRSFGADVKTLIVQTRLFKEIGKSITYFNRMEHFKIAMELLGSTVYVKTTEGNKRIVEMVETLLETKKVSSTVSDESICKLLICTDFLFPFFHGKGSASSLFAHYCLHILPNITESKEESQFSLVRMAVDLSLYLDKLKDDQHGKLCLEALFKTIDSFLAKPSSNPKDRTMPDYQFSFLESIIYVIHRVGFMHPEAFKAVTEKPAFSTLKIKLRHMLRAVLTYKVKLREELQNIGRDSLTREDVKVTSLRALTNLGIMSRELYRKKVCLEDLRISWKARTFGKCKDTVTAYSRRIAKRGDHDLAVKLYQPPNGKYSGRSGSFDMKPVRRTSVAVANDNIGFTGRNSKWFRSRDRNFRHGRF